MGWGSDAGLLPTEKVPAMREVNALAAGSWDADIVPELVTTGFIFGWVDTVQDVLDAWAPAR
ncbi:hypothetical protein GCM10009557_58850 [Virgisporangium ochraceum]|uniref:Uncharacterized protein n=1 Tax=Virgisporangium ochraceum TaxID=65505 RepID=A0A8J3ZQF1_9ACTN|nr:hypothetical protein [Virgisporangium ochraceum]GIJ68539.1 hypothetical protein Voc01_034560 [Virgisporangium ochraceum]